MVTRMGKPLKIDLSILSGKPFKTGSVQDHFRIEIDGKGYILCKTTESGSVFDIGTIFSVPDSGVNRTVIRHIIYTNLRKPETWQNLARSDFERCYSDASILDELMNHEQFTDMKRSGVATHHIGMVDAKSGIVHAEGFPDAISDLVLIEEFPVYKPVHFGLMGNYGWDYHEYMVAERKILVLEHILRLGLPGGSSLLKRYAAALEEGAGKAEEFIKSMGLTKAPEPWGSLDDMTYDCTTKYEPEDRHLAWQETIHLSGVPADVFGKAVRTIIYCTVYIAKFFNELGFRLWDVKWEIAVDGDRIYVVDTIDPDSIRITGETICDGRRCFIHFNKQAIRDYYRLIHGGWVESLNQAKKLAKTDSRGRDFIEIYGEGVKEGRYPAIPDTDPGFQEIQSRKYALMVEPFIKNKPVSSIEGERIELMKKEIEFYRKSGKLNEFLKLNSVE